jgi:heavy metal sensor kinase
MARYLKALKGLRFRLTFSHAVFFALLLAAIGLGFRENLRVETEGQVYTAIEEAWDGAKAFLRVSDGVPHWEEYPDDPEMQAAQLRLRAVHLLLDERGNTLSVSGAYISLPAPTPEDIKRVMASSGPQTFRAQSSTGVPYLIRAGRITGASYGHPYYFAIGRSLAGSISTVQSFTGNYFLALPFLVALTSLLGWWVAGGVLKPLNDVARAADKITGSNLSLQIPLRGAGDELDHMIQNFNQMTVRLHESFDQIRRFSTDTSHELRTPLTAIRGQLEVALLTAKTPTQYHEAMLKALEDVERLSRMVGVLLQLAQAEAGQLVLERVRLDLAGLVHAAVDQFQLLAEEKGLIVTSTMEPELTVMADRVQLERLAGNLLSNALKYTPAGGAVRIAVYPDAATGQVCLQVEDSGVGIAAEDLPHIFDRFYRVRGIQSHADHGLGLGLSFVASIAKAHGGHAEVSSTVGRGTCFKVYLPAAPGPAPAPHSDPVTADSVH